MIQSTPAMKQYNEMKGKYPDCLILFRMGDFYETFYEDAHLASKTLGITLTNRGFRNGPKIPLAGIPYHAIDNYLPKLVKAGLKVAICEQLEDPRFAKGLVKRGVTRIVTPGTIVEPHILSENMNNYLMCLYFDEDIGLSYVDLSTGEFYTTEIKRDSLMNEVQKLRPAEIIIPESQRGLAKEIIEGGYQVNDFYDRFFLPDISRDSLSRHFKTKYLDSYGLSNKPYSTISSGALLNYLLETQKNQLDYINKIQYYSTGSYMTLDSLTFRNLEVVQNIRTGEKEHSLLWVLDKTCTPMGARLIRKWISSPLLSKEEIDKRLDLVSTLAEDNKALFSIKAILKTVRDIERMISRVSYGSATPKDLLSLRDSLRKAMELKRETPKAFIWIAEMPGDSGVPDLIESVIDENAPTSVKEGNVIRRGYSKELDELWSLKLTAKEIILKLEEEERNRTGIKTLKIGFNQVFGYFFEVSKNYMNRVPANYVRKQTRVNGERFITQELKELEEKILNAEEKINGLEYDLYINLINKIRESTKEIQEIAQRVAMLDCIASFSEVSLKNNYTRPEISEGFMLSLSESRHPVIELIEDFFVPNDISVDHENRTVILTGPNMAGKSTFMRQVALICLMGHIGCFVPAKKARLPIIDRIFTRIGASDDLSSGQSTFMVEMIGVALILNYATEKSLILMDEIGRGTSTYDGVSIAWAVANYINSKIKGKTLFATHYHVLTKLDKMPGVKNYHIAVKEERDRIIFLRKLKEGGTDRSYGVHVAKLAGMPEAVIRHAMDIQTMLEDEDSIKGKIGKEDFVSLTKLKQKTLKEVDFSK